MKRFIDLHGQIFGYDVGEDGQDESDNLFCFYDTVTGKFEEFSGDQVFSSEDDFKMSYEGVQLERYLKLIPDKYKNK